MKILNGERGSGKTTEAIKEAYLTNSLLVVPNKITVRHIQEKADLLLAEVFGAPAGSIGVVSIYDILNGYCKNTKVRGIVIDELDWTISEILDWAGLPKKVFLATRTPEEVK